MNQSKTEQLEILGTYLYKKKNIAKCTGKKTKF